MRAKKVWFDKDKIYIETDEGRTLYQSILYYHRLTEATDKERSNYKLRAYGIHWDDIDEDVSYESFEYNNLEPIGISKVFLTHPEINVSAIARRIGIKQSLLAQYISGIKNPSKEREQMIIDSIKQIGKELSNISI